MTLRNLYVAPPGPNGIQQPVRAFVEPAPRSPRRVRRAVAAHVRRRGGVGGFDFGQFAGDVFEGVQTVTTNVVEGAEDAACELWNAALPPPLKKGLQVTQQAPWRDVWRGANLTLATVAPFLVMPFTLPLALFFYPILIWLETSRIAFAIFANCGRVTDTLQQEAADALNLLDALSPTTPQGRLFRKILTMAGASPIVDAYDSVVPSLRAILDPAADGRPVSLEDVVQFATASAEISGDVEFSDFVTSSSRELAELEENIAVAADVVGALSPNATHADGKPLSPPYYSDEELKDMFGDVAVDGPSTTTKVVVGLGLAAGLVAAAKAYANRKKRR